MAIRIHNNRSTALERSVINFWVGGGGAGVLLNNLHNTCSRETDIIHFDAQCPLNVAFVNDIIINVTVDTGSLKLICCPVLVIYGEIPMEYKLKKKIEMVYLY